MIRALWVVLCGLVLAVPACCGLHHHCCESHVQQQSLQYPEPPFEIQGGTPGAGLVFGTADFGSAGSVLIKIQVEDRSDYHQGTFTVWSGTTNPQNVTASNVATEGTQVYTSNVDVPLRYWTTHLDRTYPAGAQYYWLFVEVNYLKASDNSRHTKYFLNSWPPSPTPPAPLDEAHDFIER